jgi:hypothetical protein
VGRRSGLVTTCSTRRDRRHFCAHVCLNRFSFQRCSAHCRAESFPCLFPCYPTSARVACCPLIDPHTPHLARDFPAPELQQKLKIRDTLRTVLKRTSSRGGVRLPTGGNRANRHVARERSVIGLRCRGQQTRLDSGADGHSPDERERDGLRSSRKRHSGKLGRPSPCSHQQAEVHEHRNLTPFRSTQRFVQR